FRKSQFSVCLGRSGAFPLAALLVFRDCIKTPCSNSHRLLKLTRRFNADAPRYFLLPVYFIATISVINNLRWPARPLSAGPLAVLTKGHQITRGCQSLFDCVLSEKQKVIIMSQKLLNRITKKPDIC